MRQVPPAQSAAQSTNLIEQVIADQTTILQMLRSVQPLPEWVGLALTVSQLTALFILYRRESASVGELGQLLGLSKARVSLLVNALVSQELVERHQDADDRRRAALRLSARAHALLSEHYEGSRLQFAAWLAELQAADLASLAHGMRALAAVATPVEGRNSATG
jgi:DNA-binding MarR family transcriptional regulator